MEENVIGALGDDLADEDLPEEDSREWNVMALIINHAERFESLNLNVPSTFIPLISNHLSTKSLT